jgi:peptidoglycan/LPS O-acetylase OafA/YrhL
MGGSFTAITGWVELGAALRSALPFFFFLSAFLLYRPYVLARLGDGPRPALRTFWWRRLLRIVPAYWVALTLIAATMGLPGVFGPDGWRYYTFLYIYSHHTVTGGLIPAWTLCVDMSFYLVLPLFALALDQLWRRMSLRAAVNAELAILAAIWLASTAYWFVLVSGARVGLASLEMREVNLVANLNWFTFGMAVAVLSASDRHRPSWVTRLLSRKHAVSLAWGAAAVTFLIIARTYYTTGETTRHLLALLFCALIFTPAALVPDRTGAQRLLTRPSVTWLGVISYGVYLYHAPVLNELRSLGIRLGSHGLLAYVSLLAVAIPLTVAVGAISFYVLEQPLMRWGRRPHRLSARGPAALPATLPNPTADAVATGEAG